VNNRVTEEIIKITFGDNWLIAAFVFVVAVSAIRFIRKNNLPKYFRKCLIVCVCAIAALIDSKFFQWNEYLGALRIRKVFPLLLLTVIVVTIAIFIYSYMKNDKQLKYVIKNTESDGNIIKASEKLFRGDKSYLGNKSIRVYSEESARAKILVEFVAMILRCKMYIKLKEEIKNLEKKPNYMTVPAALKELEKIEMVRQLDNVYRLDHAVTANQKTILNAFGLDANHIKYYASELSKELKKAE